MLVPIVLGIFSEAHSRKAQRIEGRMIAAAAEAVEAIHQRHRPVGYVALRDRLRIARDVARGRIVLAALRTPLLGLLGSFRVAGAFGEHTQARVVDDAVLAARGAHDVVVEISLHPPALRLRVVGEHRAAVQTLLLAREHAIDEGRRKFVAAQDPYGFYYHGDP